MAMRFQVFVECDEPGCSRRTIGFCRTNVQPFGSRWDAVTLAESGWQGQRYPNAVFCPEHRQPTLSIPGEPDHHGDFQIEAAPWWRRLGW